MTKDYANGNYINYESDEDYASYGLYYLKNLYAEEAQVFFNQAYAKGEAPFQDKNGYRFTLIYKGGEYTLISKK